MAGFDITKILNKQTTAQTENAVTEDFEEIKLDYGKIVITGKNKYSMNDIEDLAAGIEMAGGLLDPLILGRVNGEYKLAGGHRRYAAVDLLVKDGKRRIPGSTLQIQGHDGNRIQTVHADREHIQQALHRL
ncbi:MAG: ParB/RepB/Spo0J family partition protein [Lachnospiraceae bacterium]